MSNTIKCKGILKKLLEFLKSQPNQPESYSINIREDFFFTITIHCNGDFIGINLLDGEVRDVEIQTIKRFMYKHRQIN